MIMKITSAQKEYGPGYAWLDMGCEARDDMRVIVERHDTEKDRYLGPSGWQNTPEELAVTGANPKGLLLGPQIVDFLRDGDYVTLSIPMAQFEELIDWPSIPMSGRKTRGHGMVAGIARAPAGVHSGSPPIMAQSNGAAQSLDDGAADQKSTADDLNRPPRRGLFLSLLGLAILIVLIGGGSFVWFYHGQWIGKQQIQAGSEPHPAPQRAESSTPPAPQAAPAQANASPAAGNVTAPVAPVHGAEYWSTLLRNSAATPQQLFDAAQQTSRENLPDLSGEFLYQAALRGHRDAQRAYADIQDPTNAAPPPAGMSKNARTALEFYTKLTASGDQSAQADIARICASIKPDYYVNATARTAFDDYCH